MTQAFTNPDTKGIYRTQADFDQHHLEFSAPASSRKVIIRTHEFLGAPHVTIDSGGQKYYILKVELFGYSDGKKNFRFFEDQAYEIIDTAGFYLYAKSALPKEKGSIVKTEYFFSTSGSDAIQPLTIENLKAAYPAKTAFRYALDVQFGRDSHLLDYDNQLKTYKLKAIFQGF
ncbi:hypothetical protein [Dinghuibacter silviterrae]|uniref:hypothetical protein n=1 Tax=Dinghuibacter silviterrae TaxID=1539049 RepID=UPI001063DCA6|nr:hypothetical protein [Dinghuibacter silviterrae]